MIVMIPRFQIVPRAHGIHVSNNEMLRLSESSCDGREGVGPRVAFASPTPRTRNQRAELKITPSTLIMVNRKLIHPWMLVLRWDFWDFYNILQHTSTSHCIREIYSK